MNEDDTDNEVVLYTPERARDIRAAAALVDIETEDRDTGAILEELLSRCERGEYPSRIEAVIQALLGHTYGDEYTPQDTSAASLNPLASRSLPPRISPSSITLDQTLKRIVRMDSIEQTQQQSMTFQLPRATPRSSRTHDQRSKELAHFAASTAHSQLPYGARQPFFPELGTSTPGALATELAAAHARQLAREKATEQATESTRYSNNFVTQGRQWLDELKENRRERESAATKSLRIKQN